MILLAVAVTLGLIAWMAVAWAYQRAVANGGWTDVFWSYGMGVAGVAVALWPLGEGAPTPRQWIAAALMVIWSLRLGTHLLTRVSASEEEDPRYAGFRKGWGKDFQPRMFGFLQAQAVSGALLCLAILVAARNPAQGLAWSDIAAGVVLAAGIGGEALADEQMRRFKTDPANHGRICDQGLWAWSRHPNYFFEWTIWLAWPVMAIGPNPLQTLADWPWGLLSLIGPAFMAFLLIKVSGVPPLEAVMLKSRGKAYEAYQARVSSFFPLPPKA
jgi:steroid 5-alpha reductase family enzyme